MQALSALRKKYSDYDLRRVSYFYTCLLYEVSKFIILGVFFYLLGLLPEYLFSVLFICPLRVLSGGLHFRGYMGCLLFSILYFSVGIIPFFDYYPTKEIALLLLIPFAIINIAIGPITSDQRPELSRKRRLSIKKRVLILFVAYCLCFFFSGQNHFFYLASRLLLIHTAQMIIAFMRKEVAKW